MSNEITSTAEIAETEWNGEDEPNDVRTDMVATHEPEGRGIEFHVSMRDYTQRDMEDLIVTAAAQMIVGKHNNHEMARAIEAKCIELINAKAGSALAAVTTEIIDQPLTPQYAWAKDKPSVTMREFLGLYGREYLTQQVDYQGNPAKGYDAKQTRMQYFVERHMDKAFKSEIEKATSAAIGEIRTALRLQHEAMLKEELRRFREAIAHSAASAAVSVKS